MAQITNDALGLIKGDNIITGRLMVSLNKSAKTIERMIAANDSRLTRPSVLQIIREETGLTDEEILGVETEGTEKQRA